MATAIAEGGYALHVWALDPKSLLMVDGSVVAITGASSGIGRATALHLAKAGARGVLGSRGEEGLSTLVTEIVSTGGQAVYRVTDVSKREDLQQLVALAQINFGRLDVLFSNAGAMPIGPMDDLVVDDWETMVDVNI
jgi:NADP-dependent 3-hydroxy acid dehydrogenase YdfG